MRKKHVSREGSILSLRMLATPLRHRQIPINDNDMGVVATPT